MNKLLLISSFLFFSFQLQAQQDTLMVRLHEVEVRDAARWQNDTARYRFNQMRYYVKTIMPYVDAAAGTFSKVEEILQNDNTGKQRRKRKIKEQEALLKTEFEDKIKSLNETQGVLLIKLIARQTGLNVYTMLQEVKGPLTAVKWQTWARLHGFHLNKQYNPEDEPLLERVMLSLGYELPDYYSPSPTTAQRPQ